MPRDTLDLHGPLPGVAPCGHAWQSWNLRRAMELTARANPGFQPCCRRCYEQRKGWSDARGEEVRS